MPTPSRPAPVDVRRWKLRPGGECPDRPRWTGAVETTGSERERRHGPPPGAARSAAGLTAAHAAVSWRPRGEPPSPTCRSSAHSAQRTGLDGAHKQQAAEPKPSATGMANPPEPGQPWWSSEWGRAVVAVGAPLLLFAAPSGGGVAVGTSVTVGGVALYELAA